MAKIPDTCDKAIDEDLILGQLALLRTPMHEIARLVPVELMLHHFNILPVMG